MAHDIYSSLGASKLVSKLGESAERFLTQVAVQIKKKGETSCEGRRENRTCKCALTQSDQEKLLESDSCCCRSSLHCIKREWWEGEKNK